MSNGYWSKYKWVTHEGKLPLFIEWGFGEINYLIHSEIPQKILDLGVGDGKLIFSVPKFHHLFGIDTAKDQLEITENIAKNNNVELELRQGSFDEIPLDSNSIDIIISNAALHHGKDKKKIFQEVYRVLKENGKFVFADFYNISGSKYKDRVNKKIQRNEDFAEQFTRSLKDTYNSIPEKIKENHPPEYHVDPFELMEMLQEVGFRKCELIPGFDCAYSIIYAKK